MGIGMVVVVSVSEVEKRQWGPCEKGLSFREEALALN